MRTLRAVAFYLWWATSVAQSQTELPYATLLGATIELQPSKARFTIPQNWIELYHDGSFNNLHLTREQLERVREPDNMGWDKSCAKIVNAILPFQNCAVHAGGDGWGAEDRVHGDVQMRAYIGQWSIGTIRRLVKEQGLAVAKTVAAEAWQSKARDLGARNSREQDLPAPLETLDKETLEEERVGEWHRSRVSCPLWNVDYGGTGNVDFYSRIDGRQTVVLVFMYSSGANQSVFISPIIASFKPGK